MSKLEQTVVSLVELFEEHSKEDRHKKKLSQKELKQLLDKELSNEEFKKKFNPEEIAEVMEKLDKNRDGEINFREFCQFVTILARGYFRQKNSKNKGKEGTS